MSRVIIRVGAKDLVEVINSLQKTQNFLDNAEYTLEVGIEDIKENYQYLSNSPKILYWDFIKDNDDCEKAINNDIPKPKDLFNGNEELMKIFNYFTEDNNFPPTIKGLERLDYLVYRIFIIKKYSPGLKFTLNNIILISNRTNLPENNINPNNSPLYKKYKDFSFHDSLEDIIKYFNTNWNTINLKNIYKYFDFLSCNIN